MNSNRHYNKEDEHINNTIIKYQSIAYRIKYMNKNICLSPSEKCLTQRVRLHMNMRSKCAFRIQNNRNIPSIQQAQQITKGLEKQHKWRKQRRLKLLKNTYDQNCRLYLSINSQKSTLSPIRNKFHTLSVSKKIKQKCHSFELRKFFNETDIVRKKQCTNKDEGFPHRDVFDTDQFRIDIRQILKQVKINEKMSEKQKEFEVFKHKLLILNSLQKKQVKKSQRYQEFKQINKGKNTFAFITRSKRQESKMSQAENSRKIQLNK